MNSEVLKYIQDALNAGTSVANIAEHFNKSRAWVHKKIKKNNLKYDSPKLAIQKKQSQIVKMFQQTEMSLDELAEMFECCKSNISLTLKKYGVSVPTERKNKNREKSVYKKYGKNNVMHVDSIIQKREEYFNETFGYNSPFESPEIQAKANKTLIKNHGVDNPLKSDIIKRKVINTNWDKYGGAAPACNPVVLAKMKDTNSELYGVDNYKKIHLSKETIELRSDDIKYSEWLIEKHHKEKLTLVELAIMLGTEKSCISADMKRLGLEVKHFARSKFEREIEDYIRTIYLEEVHCNDRSFTYELDVYLKDINIAVEADGLYYHSFDTIPTSKQKYYHSNKTQLCIKNNIRLFHIWECEWNDPAKNKIWRSILKSNICPNSNIKIGARECEVREVLDLNLIRDFYNYNHLQGFVGSKAHFGLFYKGELVSAMSFSSSKEIEGTWHLTRLVSKLNHSIVGGPSKLFSKFKEVYKPKEVYTFADLRYSYGRVYEILGFNKELEVKPRYSYTDCKRIIHRRSFQKNKLKALLGDKYDPNKTEFQNIFENTRYRVLYDAGKWKYVYKP